MSKVIQMKPCPKCRGNIPTDAKVCVHCGESFEPSMDWAQWLLDLDDCLKQGNLGVTLGQMSQTELKAAWRDGLEPRAVAASSKIFVQKANPDPPRFDLGPSSPLSHDSYSWHQPNRSNWQSPSDWSPASKFLVGVGAFVAIVSAISFGVKLNQKGQVEGDYRKIQIGMTEEELRTALGEPESETVSESGYASAKVWGYDGDRINATILYGKVIARSRKD